MIQMMALSFPVHMYFQGCPWVRDKPFIICFFFNILTHKSYPMNYPGIIKEEIKGCEITDKFNPFETIWDYF